MQLPSSQLLDAVFKGKASLAEGCYADPRAANLYLHVTSPNAMSWVFRWKVAGKRYSKGLGSFLGNGAMGRLTLTEARDEADKVRVVIRAGGNPIVEKKRAKQLAVFTFRVLLEEHLTNVVAQSGKASNREHNVNQWRNSLTTHAAAIMDKSVADITFDDVHQLLLPIWSKRKLGELVRSRIEKILFAAKAKKLVTENVALYKGNLDGVLTAKPKKSDAKHHASLDYEKLPALVARLVKRNGLSAKALLAAILTGGRTSEVLYMQRAELDLDAARWVIPAERMKADKDHTVTLSTQVVELLRSVPVVEGSTYVFAKPDGSTLSSQALRDMLNKSEAKGGMAIPASEATPHGFRSTFTDYIAEETDFDVETAEMAVAHSVKGVRKAYRRRTAEKKRVGMMQTYANYAYGVDNVVEADFAKVAA